MSKKIKRTTGGLRDALFDEMDALTAGKSNAQKASAKAKLAVQIINTTKLEMEYQKYVNEIPKDRLEKVDLAPIALGSNA